MSKQFIKYSLVGGLGTTGHYLTLVLGTELLAMTPTISTSLGFLVGAIINYILNYEFTFNSDVSHRKAITRFFSIAAVGFVINLAIFNLFTNNIGVNYILSQIFCTTFVMGITFALNKKITF